MTFLHSKWYWLFETLENSNISLIFPANHHLQRLRIAFGRFRRISSSRPSTGEIIDKVVIATSVQADSARNHLLIAKYCYESG